MLVIKYFVAVILSISIAEVVSAQAPLRLWYDKPAEKWVEALPIGNGRLGAMIFGGVAEDRIQFNEETLWTGSPRQYNRAGAYLYLDSIRQLLFEGRQKAAEALAESQFMGLKSNEGERDEWLKQVYSLKGVDGNPALPSYDDSKWKTIQVPSYDGWEVVGFDGLDGAVWMRTSFDLPRDWQEKDLILDLNRIRDWDITYVNGKQIGTQQNTEARRYTIPAKLLKPGKNFISVQILNFTDKGGITGYKDTIRHIGVYPVSFEQSKISLNGQWKYFIQNDNPPAVGAYQASYQPFGDLLLKFKHKNQYSNYRRDLNISDAIVSTSYRADGIDYHRTYFISQPQQVMVINLDASKKSSISFDLILTSPHKDFVVKKIDDRTIALTVKVRNGALYGESQVQIRTKGGAVETNSDKIVVKNADHVEIFLAAATNYQDYQHISADPHALSSKAISGIALKSLASIKADHVREYQQWFNKFSIRFGNLNGPTANQDAKPTNVRLKEFASTNDPAFVALYMQYGRYLLISSSRPGTRPANLQGIWNDLLNPPWGSKYTTNINAEMNYWPAEPLNLSAMHEPLFKMIEELAVSGQQTAKDYYNAPGWVLHHNTDLWRSTAPINAANHGIWVTGGAWLTTHLWEHYLFTQDKKFLQDRAYPIMKSAALFFDSFLIKDPVSGFLISSPSNSPEQGGLVAGPTMDHQIIRKLFNDVIDASEILKVDSDLRKQLQEKVKLIAPNRIGKYGQLQEWMLDVDDTTNKHRHISHLWGMYPGDEINWDDQPEMMKAARQSLLYRGDAATGWSLGWKINCWARFKDGEHAYQMIKMLISPANGGAGSYPNLFDAHPPFQIDGNFGGAAGIGEMLIQSHTRFLDILPALPTELNSGEVKGICARGGFVIDMKWTNGNLQNLLIRSLAGSPLTLRYKGQVIKISTNKNRVYKFDGALREI